MATTIGDAKIDPNKINELYARLSSRVLTDRYIYERDWMRNILFYLGIQWVNYVPGARRWYPKTMKKWIPRPVTNKFATHANTMIQVLTAKPPLATARPTTDNPDDIGAAEVATVALPVLYEEMDSDTARRILASWVVLTGNGVLHACYDPDLKYGSVTIPNLQCPNCGKTMPPDQTQNGACPDCQAQMVEAPAQDQSGQVMGQKMPKGRLCMEVLSPFEMYCDLESRSFGELEELMVRRRYNVDVINARWPGNNIEPDGGGGENGSSGLNMLRSVAYTAGIGVYGFGGQTGVENQSATVDFVWKKPCETYPDGLVAVYCNNKVLNPASLQMPYRDQKGNPLWTFRHVPFDVVPGRLWARTPLDDVAPKQEQRNKLESLIQLIVTRTANPVWLRPKNSGVTVITGEPGQDIEYNSIAGVGKPERIPGENIPTSIIAWLEKIDSDMEELAGTFEVLKGNTPPGVTAGTALRLLLERAVTRFTPLLQAYEKAWGDATKDALCIFQQFGTEQRMAQIQGPGKVWETKAFSSADLIGSVDIVVEVGSSIPKTSVGTQALIQDLAGLGVILPQEPETQYRILEEFGMTKLLGSIDDNIRQAERENWNFQVMQMPFEVNQIIDNHAVHILRHKQLALSSDYASWPPEMRAALDFHIVEHQMAMEGTLQANAGMGMPGSAGPNGEAPGASVSGEAGGIPGGGPSGEPASGAAPPNSQNDTSEPQPAGEY
jgi:hypothetical protein